jgi:hypothetical protein
MLVPLDGLLHLKPPRGGDHDLIITVGVYIFKELYRLTILPKPKSQRPTLIFNRDVLKRIIIGHLNAHSIILDRKIKGRLTHTVKTDLKN